MNKVRLIAKNSVSYFIGNFAGKIISLFTLIYIARYLGVEGYGKYTFILAFISFFSVISELGFLQILVREIARNNKIAGKFIGNTVIITFFLSVFAFLLSFLATHVLNYPVETRNAILIVSFGLLLACFKPFGIIYEVYLKMEYSVFFTITGRLSYLILIIFFINHRLELNWFILGTVISDAIQTILMVYFSKRFVKPEFKIDLNLCKFLFKEALPLVLSSVFVIIYFKINIVMLSMIKDDAAVGVFSAAYRLIDALTFIPSVLMISMFPIMSRAFNDSKETLYLSYRKSVKYLSIIALPLAAGTTFIADKIILYIYGESFQASVITLQILIWSVAFMFLNVATGQLLLSTNKQKILTFTTAIGAFFNIILNLILIPKYSYSGAAIATVITETINLVTMMYFLPVNISKEKLIYDIRGPLIATGTMSIFLFVVLRYNIGLIVIIPSFLIYFIALYLFNGVDEFDIKIISKVFKH